MVDAIDSDGVWQLRLGDSLTMLDGADVPLVKGQWVRLELDAADLRIYAHDAA